MSKAINQVIKLVINLSSNTATMWDPPFDVLKKLKKKSKYSGKLPDSPSTTSGDSAVLEPWCNSSRGLPWRIDNNKLDWPYKIHHNLCQQVSDETPTGVPQLELRTRRPTPSSIFQRLPPAVILYEPGTQFWKKSSRCTVTPGLQGRLKQNQSPACLHKHPTKCTSLQFLKFSTHHQKI